MNKDVIYIDVDDDITAIIGKVKDSKEKIIALVPPKRIGVLQSAVNLRLLNRAATQQDKRLVLISNNPALIALAAAAKVPVAKNLQSKPELAEISAVEVDDDDDVIDGNQLSVGDHAKTVEPDSAIEKALRDDAANTTKATPPAPGETPPRPRAKSGVKVPNFNSFRKKLIFGIGGGVLLVGFLIWAAFFAPSATVIITARTSDTSTNAKVTLSQSLTTDASASTIKAVTQEIKKDTVVEFDATGTKQVGEKASGSITIRNCDYADGFSLPAGTTFTAAGKSFTSAAATSVPGYTSPSSSTCTLAGASAGKATVSVQASDLGSSFNLSARTYTIDSIPTGSKVSATGTDMAGGTEREVKVVSGSDIEKATDKLKQENTDAIKAQLKDQFDDSVKVLDSTFTVNAGDAASTPAVDQELATGKAKLSSSITYTMTGIDSSEYGKYLDAYFAKSIESKTDQRVFENGAKGVSFTNVNATDGGYTANIVATAKIGPKIDDSQIKNTAKGKRYGEIQSSIEAIQGVDDVDVKFWPFWVSAAPNDASKIKIEFNLNES
jgi:hypothetical protein